MAYFVREFRGQRGPVEQRDFCLEITDFTNGATEVLWGISSHDSEHNKAARLRGEEFVGMLEEPRSSAPAICRGSC